MSLRVRRRTRLRRKDVAHWLGMLARDFGMDIAPGDTPVDEAEAGDLRLLFLGPDPIAILLEDRVAPTVRGLLAHPARDRFVTVDMGAVPYLYNGADVMAPGIVDADPRIQPGDIVWIRDEKHRRPLAVGKALMDGATMAREERGKAADTIHHVGDALWNLGEEEA